MTDRPPLKLVAREAFRIALPYFRSEERWIACGLLALAVGAQLWIIATAVATNYWRNAFFQTLQERDWAGFWYWFWIYCAIGIPFILGRVYQPYLDQWLQMRWRCWLTAHYLDRWLDGSVHYRALIAPNRVDNPDQRIAEDIRSFIDTSLALTVGLVGAVAQFLSFVVILWTLSGLAPLVLFGKTYGVPGYLVWAALIYAVLGSIGAHFIGRRLIPLDFEQQRREADFRFALVRARENSEAIALLRGEGEERKELSARFRAILRNWYHLMHWRQLVGLFAEGYKYYSVYFPYLALAPLYFGGGMQLGPLMQAGQAFNQVRSAFSYFVESYLKVAELAATVQRLAQFETSMRAAEAHLSYGSTASGAETVAARDLVIAAPDATPIAALASLKLRRGEAVLITGASGAGKTSLLRGVAGIWPHATGMLATAADRPLALPQRAYMPLGTLRHALAYPQDATALPDAELHAALAAVGLCGLDTLLDVIEVWDRRLSEGERQRLSVARALLFKPDLLLLDEATAALDEPSEVELHRLLRSRLANTAILAVSHRDALSKVYDRVIQLKPAALHQKDGRDAAGPAS